MLEKTYKPFNFTILKQGGPVLNSGIIVAENSNFVAAEIDLSTKRAVVDCNTKKDDGEIILFIGGDKETLHLKKGLENEWTEISFPDYKNFDLFLSEITRYTLRVCLIKNENQ